MKAEFVLHASRALFASAWADMADECESDVIGPGVEIMSVMPANVDPAAIHAAETLLKDIERVNGKTLGELFAIVETLGDGDRDNTMEFFGHYCAMQAMGHGVGLYDAFGSDVYKAITVPYVEFGSHSLEKDYF